MELTSSISREIITKQDHPNWFLGTNYLTVMGSRAYNTHAHLSDWDFYGFVVPPIEVVFPHLRSSINGFGRMKQNFEQLQYQHMETNDYGEVDVTIYNIVKYVQLLMEGNPNIIDSLFTRRRCHLEFDAVASKLYSERHLFLSQKCYHTFKGMMFSHLSRIKSGHIKEGRKDKGFSWDVKDGYHSLRMALQLKDVCFIGDLDVEKYSEVLKQVRNGEWSKNDTIDYCEKVLVEIEDNKDLFVIPHSPDEKKIKEVLITCLEMHYGYDLEKIGYVKE